jgi:phosphohistidine phosphatase
MRRLMLLRHARAAPAGFADFDRALTGEGRSAARAMGAFMAGNGLDPDLVLISSARRAAETWDIVAASLPDSRTVRHDRLLYEASGETLLTLVRGIAPDYRSALIIGHNPGLEQLARTLAGGGDGLQRLMEKHLPPGALVVIDFETGGWKRIERQGGRLAAFITPAGLAGGDEQ